MNNYSVVHLLNEILIDESKICTGANRVGYEKQSGPQSTRVQNFGIEEIVQTRHP